MKRTTPALRLLLGLAVPLAPSAAHADAAACQPMISALARLAQMPSHQFMSLNMAGTGPKQSEVVITGSTMWLQVGGRWQSIPYDAQQKIAKLKRKMTESSAAGKVSCARVRDEAIGGEAATLYTMRDDTVAGVVNSQVWISTTRGLPLRQVIDIPEVKSHMESRIDYNNVQAPAAH